MRYLNSEHYPDPTAGQALENIEKERINTLIKLIKDIIRKHDFTLLNRIELKDNETGKIYK